MSFFFCQTIATILIMPWRGGLLDTPMHKLRESQSFPRSPFGVFFWVPKTSQVIIPSTHHLFNPSVPKDKAPMQLSVHFGAEIFHEKVAWYGFLDASKGIRVSLGSIAIFGIYINQFHRNISAKYMLNESYVVLCLCLMTGGGK